MGKGKYRFKLSDMIPGSWFYKLINMRSRGRRRSRGIQNSMEEKHRVSITEKDKSLSNQNPISTPPPHQSYTRNRSSYYTPSRDRADKLLRSPPNPKASDTLFPLDTPRKSKSRSQKKPMISSASSVCTCRKHSSSVPLHRLSAGFDDELRVAGRYLPLPPIITKRRSKEFDKPLPMTTNRSSKQVKLLDYSNMRRSPPVTQRIKMRINSPKLLKNRARQRKALEESFVVMKSPSSPRREFRESMVEMIVHHNLRAEKDLEELLACYLMLNSDEYHDLIVKVFKQIWFDLTGFNSQSTRK